MKRKILLVDESLTVQKVVALTLDKQLFTVSYAKSRNEAMRAISESPPDLVLVAEQVADINPTTFPKEVEGWVRPSHAIPPVILITTQDLTESRGYAAVLRKPFSPQSLQSLVAQHSDPQSPESPSAAQEALKATAEDFEARRLESVFNDTFSDEARLVQETLAPDEVTVIAPLNPLPDIPGLGGLSELSAPADRGADRRAPPPPERPAPRRPERTAAPAPLWVERPVPEPPPTVRQAARAANARLWSETAAGQRTPEPPPRQAAHSTVSELSRQLESEIDVSALDEAVQRALDRIVPPIVERIVQQRLDALLQDRGAKP